MCNRRKERRIPSMPLAQQQPYYRSRTRRIRDRVARAAGPRNRRGGESLAGAVAEGQAPRRPLTSTR
jgi:hypothetical protein